MPDFIELLREMMTLTSSVGELKEAVGRLGDKVERNTERIIKLEDREELLAQKMANTALRAVFDMSTKYFDRLTAVENQLKSLPPTGSSNP